MTTSIDAKPESFSEVPGGSECFSRPSHGQFQVEKNALC
jgi:hypothetical protein